MVYVYAQKILYGGYMLSGEVGYWLDNARQRFEANDYSAKFEELSRFCPHCNGAEAGMSKCNKVENGLLPEIKQFSGYREIRQFSVLVNKCHIYDEDRRARSYDYKRIA
ncbi:hypothetical protein KIW84_074858 [Lathyrus oleraceus]|uniref:Uncharacterized protein n=1 Tax=Pisum sativum TaxID=3888 RepID=A0A9D4ZZ53_PEA|nr:hypothetical protein KIW84_074858 [Pisum sativum]